MKKQELLNELKSKKQLELVEHSDEISESYIEKSDNSFKAAKLLFDNNLFDDSISSAYYSVYNTLMALFFKVGIKCENHTASLILLKELFNENELCDQIFKSKNIRENAQYFITKEKTKETSKNMIKIAEEEKTQLRLIIHELSNEKIEKLRKKFKEI